MATLQTLGFVRRAPTLDVVGGLGRALLEIGVVEGGEALFMRA